MFRNRYFQREEGGANVRQVYVETELMRALSLAGSGQADAARNVLKTLGKPVEGLDFTSDGMEPFIENARVEYYRGLIEKKLGDDAAAREHWTKASSERGVFGALAARELGRADWKARITQIAGGTARRRGGSVERGVALIAEGRVGEGREVLHEILRAPDRNLSHYMARRALAMAGGPQQAQR
jgi:hypothetical protein